MKIYKAAEERTVGHLIEDKAITHGDRPFLFFKDDRYSYKDLHQGSNRVANALRELGVKKGDKVVTILPNFPEYLYIWWGIVKLGAWEVPINNNYRGAALVDVVNRSDAKLAVVGAGLFLNRFRAIQDDLDNIEQVVVAHSLKEAPPAAEERGLKFNSYALADLMTASADSPGVPVFNWDPECIFYTSGTTGPPKGAVVSHEYFIYFAEQKALHMETTAGDVMYNCLPMYNPTGQLETCLAALIGDAQFALAEGFNARTFWDDIRKYNCTEFVSMGGILSLVEKEPPRPDDANNPLKKIYIVPLPVDFQQRFEKRFNVQMVEIFGQTETGIVTYRDLHNPVMGSAGRAVEGYEVKIFDEHDNEVPPGTEGEIVVRPKRPHIMMEEYYKMPEKTAPRLRHCWWHTGDLGKMDAEGNLYFIRRKEECIRFRGFLISTTDVEKVVSQHSAVLECAAYGVPDESGQEQDVMVAVRPREGMALDPADLLRHVEKDLPYYMVPRYVRFVEEFEKTPTMRIIKAGLEKEAVTADTWDRRRAGFKLSRE
ncbi:MAG TPA: AMP-binding protein [Dehalococcoidia bacterium]|nr:AMP-binding protein [Dehalococcoidia bacterium]